MKRQATRREFVKKGAIASAVLAASSAHVFLVASRAFAVSIDPAAPKNFASGLRGRLIRPGDKEYESARQVWNFHYDTHPAMIAQCATTKDVVRCVEFARKSDLRVAVRSGGHSYAGFSTCDDGIVIDLSAMRRVDVDAGRRASR